MLSSVFLSDVYKGDVMKVWPPGKHGRAPIGGRMRRRARRHAPCHDLANWVLHDEKLLVETKFGGDTELYRAWRDRLWSEMHETMHRPGVARRVDAEDEEYVVMTAFGGNWAQYRVCRDRLREELWQIMKVTSRC